MESRELRLLTYLDQEILEQKLPHAYLRFRRIVELLLIFIVFPLLMIAFAFIICFILATDKGPAFFRQKRPGKDGKIFTLYKFRTMYVNSDTSYLTLSSDRRVTKTGKFLRKFKLDELPQLLNVVKGEMSLIGPRPVPLDFYNEYLDKIPGYDLRHVIRPGITGWAQIQLGYTRTIDEEAIKLQYDLEYISRLRPILDLKIVVRTLLLRART